MEAAKDFEIAHRAVIQVGTKTKPGNRIKLSCYLARGRSTKLAFHARMSHLRQSRGCSPGRCKDGAAEGRKKRCNIQLSIGRCNHGNSVRRSCNLLAQSCTALRYDCRCMQMPQISWAAYTRSYPDHLSLPTTCCCADRAAWVSLSPAHATQKPGRLLLGAAS